MEVYQIAETAHELNRAYCQSIGDHSQPEWKDAPEWQKSSAINGVLFHLENPDATPEKSHENWLKQKREEGWKYGSVKNPETKEHPCFLPYGDLPAEQRAKDFIFRQTVHSLKSFLNEPYPPVQRDLTFGEKAAGVNFNPGGHAEVNAIKSRVADLIDLCHEARKNSKGEKARYYSKAISQFEDAQMNAVKAATWSHE